MSNSCDQKNEKSSQGCSCVNKEDSYVIPEINRDDFEKFVNDDLFDPEAHMRVYTLTTVEIIDGKIHQTGSAPNFKGDVMTLSTCKHDMRKTLYKNHWKKDDVWIAGFAKSGLRKKGGFSDSILLYLGKVKQIYETFFEAWNEIEENIRSKKDGSKYSLGDLYKPRKNVNNHTKDHDDYKICTNHSHYDNGFKNDVSTGLIFVFDPDKTFVFGPKGKEIEDKKYFEERTGLEGYLTERKRIDRYGRKTKLGDFISGTQN